MAGVDLKGITKRYGAMGRAIVRRPKVFLFDEPLSNLDAKLRTQMRAEIKRLHNRLGVTSIYVTHDQVEAMTLADRIVVMRDGRIEQTGTPMELFLNPVSTFVASFLGSPPMNMIEARVVAGADGPAAEFGGQQLALAKLPSIENSVGHAVTIGVRPEYVTTVNGEAKGAVHFEVDLIETLGSEALIHATLAGKPFVGKSETLNSTGGLDAVNGFTIDPALVRVFDAETGVALPGQDRTP